MDIQHDNQSDSSRTKVDAAPRTPVKSEDATLILPTKTAVAGSDSNFGASGYLAPRATDPFPPGLKIGAVRVIRRLGAGNMGVVYLARHEALERDVVIKTLNGGITNEDRLLQILARFKEEARAIAQLSHQNVAQIFDVGHINGVHYLVMEYLGGGNLGEYLESDNVDRSTLLKIFCHVAAGLYAAHKRGIVHRDIKPDNIMLNTEGDAKIVDFGLAKRDNSAGLTSDSTVLGTPYFMAPEQCDGREVDCRADIYAFGVTMFLALTGQYPVNGKSAVEVIMRKLRDPVTSIFKIKPGIDPVLGQIVDRCLAKEPEGRFETAKEVLLALNALRSDAISVEKLTASGMLSGSSSTGGFNSGLLSPAEPTPPNTKLTAVGLAILAALVLLIAVVSFKAGVKREKKNSKQTPNISPETKQWQRVQRIWSKNDAQQVKLLGESVKFIQDLQEHRNKMRRGRRGKLGRRAGAGQVWRGAADRRPRPSNEDRQKEKELAFKIQNIFDRYGEIGREPTNLRFKSYSSHRFGKLSYHKFENLEDISKVFAFDKKRSSGLDLSFDKGRVWANKGVLSLGLNKLINEPNHVIEFTFRFPESQTRHQDRIQFNLGLSNFLVTPHGYQCLIGDEKTEVNSNALLVRQALIYRGKNGIWINQPFGRDIRLQIEFGPGVARILIKGNTTHAHAVLPVSKLESVSHSLWIRAKIKLVELGTAKILAPYSPSVGKEALKDSAKPRLEDKAVKIRDGKR